MATVTIEFSNFVNSIFFIFGGNVEVIYSFEKHNFTTSRKIMYISGANKRQIKTTVSQVDRLKFIDHGYR